jgi:hypothetical protein
MSKHRNNSARMAKKKMAKTYTPEEIDELPEFAEDDDDFEDDDYDEEEEEDDEPEDEAPDVESMEVASLQDILNVDDTAEEKFYVKEWDKCIIIRGITKNELDHMRRASRSKNAKGRSRDIVEREIVLAGVVQPRIGLKDYNLLLEKSAGAIVRILNAITEKSGMGDSSEKARERRFPRQR